MDQCCQRGLCVRKIRYFSWSWQSVFTDAEYVLRPGRPVKEINNGFPSEFDISGTVDV